MVVLGFMLFDNLKEKFTFIYWYIFQLSYLLVSSNWLQWCLIDDLASVLGFCFVKISCFFWSISWCIRTFDLGLFYFLVCPRPSLKRVD